MVCLMGSLENFDILPTQFNVHINEIPASNIILYPLAVSQDSTIPGQTDKTLSLSILCSSFYFIMGSQDFHLPGIPTQPLFLWMWLDFIKWLLQNDPQSTPGRLQPSVYYVCQSSTHCILVYCKRQNPSLSWNGPNFFIMSPQNCL